MGRGRSKAKETKVARDLKYSNSEMDLERLAKELHGELDGNKSTDSDDAYTNDDYSKYK
jgi:hypothetical protein